MKELTNALGQAYGLAVQRVERIDYGIWEESFSVWTDQGHVYAKRFLRRDRQIENMLRGLRLSQDLRAAGFPAPEVVRTVDGSLLAQFAGERYQVNAWVEGRSYHPGELPVHAAGPMGALLGRFHRLCGPKVVPPSGPATHPRHGARLCRELLDRYEGRSEAFAATAREVLQAQIALLERLPEDFPDNLPRPALGGTCFNSFWVEQVLFDPDGQVAALVDWTDGAGKVGHWVDDLDTGIHLSALDVERTIAFVQGYQSENPLPEREWRSLAADLCYGHLASTNFFEGWLRSPYRRMEQWEQTSAVWHRLVVERYTHWPELEERMVAAAAIR